MWTELKAKRMQRPLITSGGEIKLVVIGSTEPSSLLNSGLRWLYFGENYADAALNSYYHASWFAASVSLAAAAAAAAAVLSLSSLSALSPTSRLLLKELTELWHL